MHCLNNSTPDGPSHTTSLIPYDMSSIILGAQTSTLLPLPISIIRLEEHLSPLASFLAPHMRDAENPEDEQPPIVTYFRQTC